MSLQTEYRPKSFKTFAGNDAIKQSLTELLQRGKPPASFLITGPSGTGKTTLGRIISYMLGCDKKDIKELNTASDRTLPAIRLILEDMRYTPLNGKKKIILFDECFSKGTKILGSSGVEIPIEEIEVGNFVSNFSGYDLVEKVFINKVSLERVVKVTKDSGDFTFCSCDHLFYTKERKWVEAKSLKGEFLVNYQDLNLLGHKETPIDIITKVEAYQEGNEHIFSDIIGEKERTQGYVELYDLQIKYNHSYIANGNMIHNCHQLLSATQEALLKALEEPPEHVHFIMCTTNPEALKTTFKRRCHIYELSPLNSSQLMNHLKKILNAEKVENYPTTILDKIIELSDGSAGIALKYLDMVIDMKNDIDRAMETLKSSGTSETEIIDICRTLMNFQISNLSRWTRVKHLLSNFKGDAESARRPILGYFEKCLLGKSSNEMEIILMADEFKDNFYDNGKYGLTAACFKACYSPEEK